MELKVLLVDDEKSIRETLKIILENEGYFVETAGNGNDALEYLNENIVDILVTDLRMPGMNGIELMKRSLKIDPFIETIIISAYADIKSAVEALKGGAFDYIEKSFSPDELIFTVNKAIERKRLIEENFNLKRILNEDKSFEGVIGKSKKMQELFHLVSRVAGSKANILLTGESGVGKDVFAELIHRKSSQDKDKFVAINCGAIPENLIESELFGHEKGAFTGASQRKKGKFELADKGTLFLDEVGELPLQMQVKFLRVLQEREFYRVGSEESIEVNVRIIAATNKDLMEEVRAGRFREDLFYRLNVVSLDIPPLRERKEDIPVLANRFLHEFASEYEKKLKYIDIDAINHLVEYPWKGNVRELRNVVERSVLFVNNNEEILTTEQLPKEITGLISNIPTEKIDMTLRDYEKILIENTLKRNDGNKTRSAEILGIKRQTLYNKIKEYGIEA